MKNILTIYETFSETDSKAFVRYLRNRNQRGDTKNIQLFTLIEKGKHNKAAEQIYGAANRNTFYGLCSRLEKNMIEYLANKSFETEASEEQELLKVLLASRVLLEHKKAAVAFKLLKQSEKRALNFERYSILNEIYETFIQFSHLQSDSPVSEFIQLSNENMRRYRQQLKINNAHALLKESIRKPSNVSSISIVSKEFDKLGITLDASLTYKSLYQILNISTMVAQAKSDYYSISPLIQDIYEIALRKESQAVKHTYYHLKILYEMAIFHFRNKDFSMSKVFIKKMEDKLQANEGFTNQFQNGLLLMKIMNHNYTGAPLKALSLFERSNSDDWDLQLAGCMCLFQQHKFSEAYSILKTFSHTDSFYEKRKGLLWTLKKAIMEILLLIELNLYDLVVSRLQAFRRKHRETLQSMQEERVLHFLELAFTYYETPKQIKTPAFKEKLEHTFQWLSHEEEDIFVMSFYAWLKSKMLDCTIYEATLALVENKTIAQ
ncbi:hypothetical protein MG296_01285 [Flavobacteriaceae bacterium TK19130]|nr:hypothetical protein [Thermobacterium salinum]